MAQQTEIQQPTPSLITRRWKYIKTSMYHLVEHHDKFELILALLKLREEHTAAPTLTEITNFTGFDVAIHTIQNWDWNVKEENRDLEIDAAEIGKFGAEMMILHTLKESIRNELLSWDGKRLVETDRGEVHFSTLNSFNVDITGSRMDVARKRFSIDRLKKEQRSMDPVNNIPTVKRLYWENSILMLLRAPLPFYHAMEQLTDEEQSYLVDLHSKLVAKSNRDSSGMVKVRLTEGSRAADILNKLTPNQDENDRRPRFVACIKDTEYENENRVEYHVGLGGLTMFTMFLLGLVRDQLNEKAGRAERAVKDVIEHSGYWKVIESNTEVIEERGEVVTEIDIVARSNMDKEKWITCEVKDFSFWRGWIFGRGADIRKNYYENAVEKLPVKEKFIIDKYNDCNDIESIIVTSIPEPFDHIQDVPLVYLSDLYEELAKRSNVNYSPRKRHTSSNFLIRYFSQLQKDYRNVREIENPISELEEEKKELKDELSKIKTEYEKTRQTYQNITSEYDTLKVSEKLASKRLLLDEGERHYQLEAELDVLRKKIRRKKRERKLRANILRDLKKKYNKKLEKIKNKDAEIKNLENSKERQLSPRLF